MVLIGLLIGVWCSPGCISWYCPIVECYVEFVDGSWVIVAGLYLWLLILVAFVWLVLDICWGIFILVVCIVCIVDVVVIVGIV